MAATTIYCGNFDFVALAGTQWWAMGMGGGSQPAQAGRPSLIHAAGVADRVGVMVMVNDRTTASTFTTQVNGVAGSVSITIPAGQTGWFEDAVNADTLAAGNEYKGVFVAGTGGTNLRVASVRYRWTPTGAAGITLHNDGTSVPASGAHFTGIGGTLGALGSSEASVQQPVAAGTLRRLQIQMRSNTSGLASTVTLRVNGVDTALVVTIPANQTGLFEDAVNSVVVADGDLVSLRWDVQTGGATWRTWRHQITHDATDAVSALGSWGNTVVVPAGASRYGPPNLLLFDNNTHILDSPLYRARVATPTTVEQCWLWVTANAATANSFYRLLKNQVSVASVTIPAGQTGAFSFAPGTSFSDGDDIGWQIEAGTGGTLTVSANAFRLAPAAGGTPVSQSVQASFEVLARPVASLAASVESLQGLMVAPIIPVESLATASATVSPAVESLQSLSAAVTPGVESLGHVARALTVPWAAEQRLDVVQLVPWESLASASAGSLSSLEILARVAREIAASLEAAGAAGTVSQSVIAAIEWLQSLSAAKATAAESLAPVTTASPSALESLAALSRAGASPIEILAQVLRAVTVPLEAAGAAGAVAQSVVTPIEWLRILSVSPVVGIETLSPVTAAAPTATEILAGVTRAEASAVEVLALAARALSSPWESAGGVTRSQSVAWESLAALLAVHGTSIEILRAVSQAQGVPLETVLRLAVLSVVPLEALGSPFISRILREIDRSGHRLAGTDLSAHRLADRDHSAPHFTDLDRSGVSS